MNAMQRSMGWMILAGVLALGGCGATHYGHDTIQGLEALVSAPTPAAVDIPAGLPFVDENHPRPLYQIGAGDEVTVVVWGRPDLGSTVPANSNNRRQVSTVNARGEIELPFVGPLTVAGLSLRGAAVAVENAYSELVSTPQVEVEVVSYLAHPVLMDGLVQNPGTLFLSNALQTVGEALAAAGGSRADGDLTRVSLLRAGVNHRLDIWASEHGTGHALDILLKGGDKLYVPPIIENQYYVLGDVASPGAYPIPSKGVTLVEGLAEAGGLKMESASFDDLLLFRHAGPDSAVYEFSYFDAVAQGALSLQPGDRLVVSQSNVTKIGHVLRNLLPALSIITSVWIVDRIINEPRP